MRLSKEGKEAVKQSLTVQEKADGKFSAPKMQFVLVEAWKPEYGNIGDQKIVMEEIKGVMQKGVWRMIGERGHYEFEKYEETALIEDTVEDSEAEQGKFRAESLDREKRRSRLRAQGVSSELPS